MITEGELAALRSEHGSICIVRNRHGAIAAVVRGATKAEVTEHHDNENPALGQLGILERALLWPTQAEFRVAYKRSAALVTKTFMAVRSISGEQCSVDIDEKAETFHVYSERDGSDEKVTLLRGGALSWPQYQRFLTLTKQSPFEARVTACIDASTFPASREDRTSVLGRLPYLADVLISAVLMLSGGDADFEGN
jgi:hypothetical protein